MNNLILSANFAISLDGELFKSKVLKYFVIGKSYSPDEIVSRLDLIFEETNNISSINKKVSALRLTKVLFQCKKDRVTKKHIIKGINPYKFKFIHQRMDFEDFESLTNSYFKSG